MTHLTDKDILEVRDGMPVDSDVVTHLAECLDCQAAMAVATEREETIRTALETLDRPVDVERAKAAVRAKLGTPVNETARPARQRPAFTWSMGKAAAMLLVAAGAAAALPGSPVREWFTSERAEPAVEAAPAPVVAPPELVGGRLTVASGPLDIELSEVGDGTRIAVTWIEGATVTVRASPGSGFSYGEGQVRASIATGPVLIDLPRDVSSVTLSVNGRMYLQGSSSGLDIEGPLAEQDGDTMTFVVRQ